jgi:beta-N-acetylhexosaminidase
MPFSRPRLKRWQVLLLTLLLAAGGAAWVFFIRDEGAGPGGAEPKREKERKEPISDDPLVRKMSTAELSRQVLLAGFEGASPAAPEVAEAGRGGFGGLLVETGNWTGAKEGAKLIAALGRGGELPSLVAVAQEGGEFRSLPDLPPEQRALDIARQGSTADAEDWARGSAAALAKVGFHLNLFPVADVATLDSPLAGRAFSDDAAEVAQLTDAALEGCHDTSLACAPLHFPGLGTASQDTAEGPATVATDLGTLQARDFGPFASGTVRKGPAIVVSLGLYPDFDPIVPAALTPSVATDLLRDEFRFRGVAISDDLASGAVAATYSVPEAAVAAIGAGIDLAQISEPNEVEDAADAIEEAVESGDLDEERLVQAVERVVRLKRKVGIVG